MRRLIAGLYVVFLACVVSSCSEGNKNEPAEFDIVGQWGVTTVTFVNADGTSNFFEQQGNSYYSYWTFQINGALIVKSNPSGDTKYGDYVYDSSKKQLSYLYDGKTRRINAHVLVHNPTTMTVTEDLQEVGETIYTMKKVAW